MFLEILIQMEKVQTVEPLFDKHLSRMNDFIGDEVARMSDCFLWRITECKEVPLQLSHANLVQRQLISEINCQLFMIRVKPLKKPKHLVIGSII